MDMHVVLYFYAGRWKQEPNAAYTSRESAETHIRLQQEQGSGFEYGIVSGPVAEIKEAAVPA